MRKLFYTACTAIACSLASSLAAQNTPAFNWVGLGDGNSNANQANCTVAATNSVYTIGTFSGSITFGGTTMTSAGGSDIYVVRYSLTGTFQALTTIGGAGNDDGRALAVFESTGNLIVAGSLNGNILVQRISTTFTNNSAITPTTNLPGPGVATGMAWDGTHVNVCGSMTGSCTFGTTTIAPANSIGLFVSELSALNPVSFSNFVIQPSTENGDNEAEAIIFNWQVGKLYITGYFKSGIEFFSGDGVMSASGTRDVFIAGLDNNHPAWLTGEQQRGGTNTTENAGNHGSDYEIGWTLATDANGVFVGGRVGSEATFTGASANLTLSTTSFSGFAVAYNFNANALNNPAWASTLSQLTGSNSNPIVYGLACDGNGRMYATGECCTKTQVTDPTNGANNFSLTYNLSGNTFACGMVGCYSTSNGARNWSGRISDVADPFNGKEAWGYKVSISGCGIYIAGRSNNQVNYGNIVAGTLNDQQSYVARLAPNLQTTANYTNCAALSQTLTLQAASGFGGTYSWTGSGPGGYSYSGSGASVSPTVSAYGTYTYVVTTSGGTCGGMTGTVTVVASALGAANAGPDNVICPPSVTIGTAAQTGCTYSWAGPSSFTSTSAQPSVPSGSSHYGTYTVTVTDACGNVTTDQCVLSAPCGGCCRVGNPNPDNQPATAPTAFMIYPNPGNGLYTVEFSGSGESEVLVTDLTGRQIFYAKTEEPKLGLDLSQSPNGIYIVKVTMGGAMNVRQLIRQ